MEAPQSEQMTTEYLTLLSGLDSRIPVGIHRRRLSFPRKCQLMFYAFHFAIPDRLRSFVT